MPIEYSVNIGFSDVYDDYENINVVDLVRDIPTKMALTLICHHTSQIHTQEKNAQYQLQTIRNWYERFNEDVIDKVETFIKRVNSKHSGSFNFINNVSSLYLIECLIENHNELPTVDNLTPEQEENLFKAYIFFSSKWTAEQLVGVNKYKDSPFFMGLIMLLTYSELFEFKDFRIQFLKAVYFFKFCEENELFKGYLDAFLSDKGLKSWNQYLFNLLSIYVTLLQEGNPKSVLEFAKGSEEVFNALENFCVNINDFRSSLDFLTLREKPIYRVSDAELMFLNLNFLIDKVYQSIIFDFADVLVRRKITYNGKAIANKMQFIGIFGDEFIESGLFYKLMRHTFRQKHYIHYTGDELKNKFGDGAPDYLIVDNGKLYVFEFKNTLFSGSVKYSYDIDAIKKELEKKFVNNDQGKPKGVTQLVNFFEDLADGKYRSVLDKGTNYIIYPIIITTDYTFVLPVIYTLVASRFNEVFKSRNLKLTSQKLTMIDLDSIIKFQDLFIERKLTLNHVLADYQKYLKQGTTEIDKSLSFHRYIHDKTNKIDYNTPKMFLEEVENSLFKL